MKHVMLDIETLGTRGRSVIASIGAVEFDPYTPGMLGTTFHEAIDLQSSLKHGLQTDASTILWWMEQKDEARHALVTKLRGADSLSTTLGAFRNFLRGVGAKEEVLLWANGTDFDLSRLQDAYEAVSTDKPWAYNAPRDYRTLRELFGRDEFMPEAGITHDALSDAIWQAKYLQNLFAFLLAAQPQSGTCAFNDATEQEVIND